MRVRRNGSSVSRKVGGGSAVRTESATTPTRVGNVNPVDAPSHKMSTPPRSKNVATPSKVPRTVKTISTGESESRPIHSTVAVRNTHRNDISRYSPHVVKRVRVPSDQTRTAGRKGGKIELESRRIGGGGAPTIRYRRRRLIVNDDGTEMEVGGKRYLFVVKPPKNKRK